MMNEDKNYEYENGAEQPMTDSADNTAAETENFIEPTVNDTQSAVTEETAEKGGPAEFEANMDNNGNEQKPFDYPFKNKKPPYVEINGKNTETGTSAGIKIFCGLLAVCILAGVCLVGGYFLGRGSNKAVNKTSISTVVKNKPTKSNAKSSAEVFEEVNKSVVFITVYNEKNAQSRGVASGVIYSSDGYILTCDHIYSQISSPKFSITLYDGSVYDAKFIAGDTRSDLAVLKINAKNLTAATFGNSNENVVGETAYAVGYPCGFSDGASITSGIISANNRRISSSTTSYSTTFTQIDSPINPGNSGGALANCYGQIIGITSSKIAGSEYEGVGFAIPSVNATSIADSLIKNGYVKGRPKLGITYTMIDTVSSKLTGMPTGLCLSEISTDSGLYGKNIAKGSIITYVNGTKITDSSVILDIIDNSKAGDEVTVTVYDTTTKDSKDYKVKLIEDKGSSSFTEESSANSSSDDGNGIFGNGNNKNNDDKNGTLPF